MKRYYFDNIATTKTDKRVVDVMLPYFTEHYAYPSSQFSHQEGIFVTDNLEEARANISKYINGSDDEIIFTSGETESNNLAIKGFARANAKKGKHLITTTIEHRSVLNSFKALEKEGFTVSYIKVNKGGLIDFKELKSAITSATILISVNFVNHEVGTIEPIEEIGNIAKEKNIVFHTNATYAMGYLPIDVKKMNIGLLTASGDKIHGPKGIGLLYKRKDINISRIFDGNFNEYYIRPGLVNIPGVIGMSKAIDLLRENTGEIERIKKMRDKLINGLLAIDDSVLNGSKENRVANNANITFYRAEGESTTLHLDMHGVSVVTGSACFSRSLEPSYVMMAMGFTHERAHGSIRYGLSRFNKIEEIDYVIDKTKGIVKKLREISPIK
ncbi:cysteine desulfurase [bacterium]|nr:cysteine desulfurase [bacterium]